jgi:hypothetical protein
LFSRTANLNRNSANISFPVTFPFNGLANLETLEEYIIVEENKKRLVIVQHIVVEDAEGHNSQTVNCRRE